jgi:hypothetical protein
MREAKPSTASAVVVACGLTLRLVASAHVVQTAGLAIMAANTFCSITAHLL